MRCVPPGRRQSWLFKSFYRLDLDDGRWPLAVFLLLPKPPPTSRHPLTQARQVCLSIYLLSSICPVNHIFSKTLFLLISPSNFSCLLSCFWICSLSVPFFIKISCSVHEILNIILQNHISATSSCLPIERKTEAFQRDVMVSTFVSLDHLRLSSDFGPKRLL